MYVITERILGINNPETNRTRDYIRPIYRYTGDDKVLMHLYCSLHSDEWSQFVSSNDYKIIAPDVPTISQEETEMDVADLMNA